jgi:ankyrin repeat protein
MMMELTLTGANIFSSSSATTSSTSNKSGKNRDMAPTQSSSLRAKVSIVNDTINSNNNTTVEQNQKVHNNHDEGGTVLLVAPSATSSTSIVNNACATTAANCTTTDDGRATTALEGGGELATEHVPEKLMESLFFQVKFGSYESFRCVMTSLTSSTSNSSSLWSSFPSRSSHGFFYDPDGHTLAHWATKRAPDLRFMDLLIRSAEFPIHFPSLDTVGMYPIHWAATEGSIPMVSLLLDYSHTQANTHTLPNSSSSTTAPNENMTVCHNNKSKVELDTKSPLFDHTNTDPQDINAIVLNPSNIDHDDDDQSTTTIAKATVQRTTKTTNTLSLSDFFENDDMCTIQPKLSKLGLSSRSSISNTSSTTSLIPNAGNVVDTITAQKTKETALTTINSTSKSYYVSEDDPMINSRDASGCTPFLVASQYGHVNLAAFLIKRGANYLAVDKNKDSALHWAAYKGDVSIIGLLCHILTSTTTTATTNTSTAKRQESITNFLSMVDSPDTFGQTPIHLAALRGNTDALEYLLEEVEANSTSPISTNNNNAINRRYSYNNAISSCPRPIRLCFALLCNKVRYRGRQDVYLPLSTVLSDDSATSTCYHHHYSPRALLEMKDNDGRTPLDLAIKYKRSDAELVLNEWYERYNLSSVSIFQRFCCVLAHDGMKLFCSIDSWRTWAGLTTNNNNSNNHCNITGSGDASSIGQRRIKWPFAVVVASMTLACALYPLRFLPIQSKVAIVMGGSFDAFMHMFTLTSLTLGWVTFLLTWKTNPGGIKPINNMKNEMHRCMSAASSSGNRRYGTESMPLDYTLQSLAFKLSKRYDEALEQLAHSSTSGGTHLSSTTTTPPLCHTCRIVRPLRSKHCRIQKQCILLFDHYCPFVGTTIGAYNYRYFYGFLFFISCSEFGFLATWIQYLIRSETFDVLVFLSGCYLSFFIIPSVGLLVYHTDLIVKNLTTNEHQNAWKYSYLQDPTTRTYNNQFDEGFLGNVYSRLFPSESSYTLMADRQSTVLGSNSDVDDLTNETLC